MFKLHNPRRLSPKSPSTQTMGLQIAQSRSYLYTLGPKVGIIHVLGALGKQKVSTQNHNYDSSYSSPHTPYWSTLHRRPAEGTTAFFVSAVAIKRCGCSEIQGFQPTPAPRFWDQYIGLDDCHYSFEVYLRYIIAQYSYTH